MYWILGIFGLQAALECLLCFGVVGKTLPFRRIVCVMAVALLVIITVLLCARSWQIWVWTTPFVAYRIINLRRIYKNRLPLKQLQTVASQAFIWLILWQVALTLIAWDVTYFHHGQVFVGSLAVLQLLSAVILLRASTHTWQSAQIMVDPQPVADRDLPALSVLIPARNETDDLDRCLQSLIACDYPKLEIVVLDDCSAMRRTPEIIRSYAHEGVRFIQGQMPDETRWLAKNFAYAQLAHAASGELLLFCGVDTRFEPQSLRELVGILETRGKDMLSVMPLRSAPDSQRSSILQAMRYYWEICLPRRFFKRPPVLSTCWLIRRNTLERMGGFESVSRSVNPEAPLARKAVATDSYRFIRSDEQLGLWSDKSEAEQYATSIRVRYPQLHRRLELVALASMYEAVFMLGPIVGLIFVPHMAHAMAYVALWGVTLFCLLITYGIVVMGARLSNPWYGWALLPVGILADLWVLNVSMWKYEFRSVDWKGRNVCVPVMHVEPRLPRLEQ